MPIQSKQWVLNGSGSLDSLKCQTVSIPALGQHDVLVKLKAVSLNYRDLAMALGKYPRAQPPGVVPGSDGAGVVVDVGSGVTEFKLGDRIATCFFQDGDTGRPNRKQPRISLAGEADGVLREYGIFPEHGLVNIPQHLDWREASTLTCAGVTAWSCLHGDRPVAPGDYVLIQGTGGVSLFGLQFAIAAGAHVIATTSSADKVELLKSLGAQHVVNYREEPNWGLKVRELTPGKVGCDIILDVGGPSNWAQSLQAVRTAGDIHLIGFLGGSPDDQDPKEPTPSFWDLRQRLCNLKSVAVGSRPQFEAMNKAIDTFKIRPVVDVARFDLDHAKDAYQYLIDAKHIGKIVIDIVDAGYDVKL
ncbi:hypothetical protein PV10_06739 [Exophiala mesophila]|uniref:Enoyl reductase (ER) domain-containing protein n=1 Tax=Exophiala mesophila TaxID=212818 RepID=A0A0D1ZC58_EXOME|nr:uncharacterized protein PV10_06739 [Exophiala mesophila]KIV92287.1 hypothetical protein PV10_06739 [Exophiala mesophila]